MAAVDPYAKDIAQIGPARNAIAVAPADDNTDLGTVSRAIMVGVSGNVVAIMSGNGQTVTFAMNAGEIYPFAVTRILKTGTTATGIVAIW